MENQQQANVYDELNYIKSLIESIEGQINVLLRGLDELRRAVSVLNEPNLSSSEETKVTIGAGIYVNAALNVKEGVFVPIGSDLYKEERAEDTISRLEVNIKDVEKSLDSLSRQRDDLTTRYESMVSLLQREGEKRGNKA